jgi:hypothetical protein
MMMTEPFDVRQKARDVNWQIKTRPDMSTEGFIEVALAEAFAAGQVHERGMSILLVEAELQLQQGGHGSAHRALQSVLSSMRKREAICSMFDWDRDLLPRLETALAEAFAAGKAEQRAMDKHHQELKQLAESGLEET